MGSMSVKRKSLFDASVSGSMINQVIEGRVCTPLQVLQFVERCGKASSRSRSVLHERLHADVRREEPYFRCE